MKRSVGFIEGYVVRITSGSIIELESSIVYINRHKREVIIEVKFIGDFRQMSIGLERVEKI
jgi:transcription antitermination factor NusG